MTARRIISISSCSKCKQNVCHNRQPKGLCFLALDEQKQATIGHLRVSATTIEYLAKEQAQ